MNGPFNPSCVFLEGNVTTFQAAAALLEGYLGHLLFSLPSPAKNSVSKSP